MKRYGLYLLRVSLRSTRTISFSSPLWLMVATTSYMKYGSPTWNLDLPATGMVLKFSVMVAPDSTSAKTK